MKNDPKYRRDRCLNKRKQSGTRSFRSRSGTTAREYIIVDGLEGPHARTVKSYGKRSTGYFRTRQGIYDAMNKGINALRGHYKASFFLNSDIFIRRKYPDHDRG